MMGPLMCTEAGNCIEKINDVADGNEKELR
jgi:hypothetical protein